MKILFLDIDGVLNRQRPTENGYCRIEAVFASRLNRIIRKTDCNLVITSSWRYLIHEGSMSREGFQNLLLTHGVDAFGRVVGITATDEDCPGRGAQITDWLSRHGLLGLGLQYVVLDNRDDGINEAGHPFVQTDGGRGLGDEDADLVVALLTGLGGRPRRADGE